MDKRFEESFNEIGLIYEAFAKKAGGQKDTIEGNHSYRKDTFTSPQGSVNQFQANLTSNVTAPVCSDEEAPEEAPEEDPIIVKLEELQKEAEDNGQGYAVLQLAELKKFIKEIEESQIS